MNKKTAEFVKNVKSKHFSEAKQNLSDCLEEKFSRRIKKILSDKRK